MVSADFPQDRVCVIYIESLKSHREIIELVAGILGIDMFESGQYHGPRYYISLDPNESWQRDEALRGNEPYFRFRMEVMTKEEDLDSEEFIARLRQLVVKLREHCDAVEMLVAFD